MAPLFLFVAAVSQDGPNLRFIRLLQNVASVEGTYTVLISAFLQAKELTDSHWVD